jgi:hypothetical protein
MDHNTKHVIALVLFGVGVILGCLSNKAPTLGFAVACVSAGLFVEEL